MTKLIYKGGADSYELSNSDFKKAGVEHGKVRFPHGEPVEVSPEAAAAILSNEHPFVGFKDVFEEAPIDDQPDDSPAPQDNVSEPSVNEVEPASAETSEMTESGAQTTSDSGTPRSGRRSSTT